MRTIFAYTISSRSRIEFHSIKARRPENRRLPTPAVCDQLGWTCPRPDRTSGISFIATRNTSLTSNQRDRSPVMSTVPLYPLRFTPILRRLIWGGRRLGTRLAQADRRRLGLRRELGNLGLSRCGQRRRERRARRFDDPRADRTGTARICSGQRWAAATSSRCWSSTSTRTRTSRFRSIPTMRRAGGWPATVARPKPGSSWKPSREVRSTPGLKRRRRPGRIRRRDPFGRRRALAPSPGAETRRLHLDRVRDRACHRRRRAAWPRSSRPRMRHSGSMTGAGSAPTASRARFTSIRHSSRSTSNADRSSRSHPRVEPVPGGGTREQLSRSAYFALERLNLEQLGVRGTTRPVHDPDGPGGILRRAARRGTTPGRIRPDALASRRRWAECEIVPIGQAQILSCVVPE